MAWVSVLWFHTSLQCTASQQMQGGVYEGRGRHAADPSAGVTVVKGEWVCNLTAVCLPTPSLHTLPTGMCSQVPAVPAGP